MKYFLLIFTFFACIGCNSPRQPDESRYLTSFKKVKEIQVIETKEVQIVRVKAATFKQDTLFVLDGMSGNLKIYDYTGKLYDVLLKKGNSPKELSKPIAVAITPNSFIIPDAASSAIKVFNRKGENINYVFLEDVKSFTSDGNIFFLSDSLFLSSFTFKRGFAKSPVITVSDKTGKTLSYLGSYPKDYYEFSTSSYPMLESRYFDIRNNYLIAITFVSSPAIQFISLDSKTEKMFPFSEKRERYISKEHQSKPNASFEEMFKISFIDMYNYAIFFVNDSTVIRAFYQKTEESYKKRSFVLRKNFIEAYSTSGDFLGELSIPGYLHDVRGDTLLIEESDEPDNRRFGLYHLVWKKNNAANQ